MVQVSRDPNYEADVSTSEDESVEPPKNEREESLATKQEDQLETLKLTEIIGTECHFKKR
jgi:hypothetical protein